ncbi:MAG TPA: FtsX-like permease family protein [Holophagaceae bacterium]|nr:FtsX-like permease family protein [Holophagaceae bacterium]
MRWLGLIWKSLMRSKRRTLLIVGSLVLSVFTVAVLQSLLTTLSSMTDNPKSSNRLVVRHKSGLTQMLPRSYEAYLRQQPEVEAVCALQWFGGYYQDPRNFFANFASDESTLFTIFKEEFGVAGVTEAQIKEYLRDGTGCIVGESLAKKNGWKVGDTVPLTGTIFPINPRLTVRLIFRSPKPSDENVLHFHYKVLEEGVPRMKGLSGSFWVRTHRPEDIPKVIERVDRHYANSAYETLSETENAFNLSFVKMLGNIGAIIQGITAAVVVAILIVTGNTMSTAIRERTTEIAVFRAMGFPAGRVLVLLLAEGVLLVAAGSLIGLWLADATAGVIRGVLGSANPFFADFAIQPRTIGVCMGGALAVGALSTFIPAYAATRRPITEGLKAVG